MRTNQYELNGQFWMWIVIIWLVLGLNTFRKDSNEFIKNVNEKNIIVLSVISKEN